MRRTNLLSGKEFAVNGTGIPDVDFDVGESYAGLLPINNRIDEERNLFFWFFPTTHPDRHKEVVIWLNGGVCWLPFSFSVPTTPRC